MKELLGTGESFAKIILIGEHAVVYNKPAIAMPFKGLKTTTKIYRSNHPFTIISNQVEKDDSNFNKLNHLIDKLFSDYEIDKNDITIEIDSNIPMGKGLGSSAALAIGLTKAFFNAFNLTLDDNTLIEYAMASEKVFHLNPSGIDVYTLVYNKPLVYIKHQGFKPLEDKINFNMLIIDSGTTAITYDAVSLVREQLLNEESLTSMIIDDIEVLTNRALKAIKDNDIKTLELILRDAQTNLSKLGLSTDVIDNIINTVNTLGVKGIKMTGAGMGGALIAITEDRDVALSVYNTLTNLGYQVWLY